MSFTHRAAAGAIGNTSPVNVTIPTLAGGGVLWVMVASNLVGGPPAAPTLTLSGATFTQAASVPFGQRRLTVWYSQDYDAATGAVLTISWSGVAQANYVYQIEEQIPGRTDGTPVVQINTASPGAVSVIASTLAAGSGDMFVTTAYVGGVGAVGTPGSGTKLAETNSGSQLEVTSYWDAVVQANPQVSLSIPTSGSAIVAIEAATTPTPPPAGFFHRAGAFGDSAATFNVTVPTLLGGGVLWVTVADMFPTGPSITTPSLSMTGATFTLAQTVTDPSASDPRRLSVFYSEDYDAGASVALAITFADSPNHRIFWSVDEQLPAPVDSALAQVAGAVVSTSDLTPGVTLASGAGDLLAFAFTATHALVSYASAWGGLANGDFPVRDPDWSVPTTRGYDIVSGAVATDGEGVSQEERQAVLRTPMLSRDVWLRYTCTAFGVRNIGLTTGLDDIDYFFEYGNSYFTRHSQTGGAGAGGAEIGVFKISRFDAGVRTDLTGGYGPDLQRPPTPFKLWFTQEVLAVDGSGEPSSVRLRTYTDKVWPVADVTPTVYTRDPDFTLPQASEPMMVGENTDTEPGTLGFFVGFSSRDDPHTLSSFEAGLLPGATMEESDVTPGSGAELADLSNYTLPMRLTGYWDDTFRTDPHVNLPASPARVSLFVGIEAGGTPPEPSTIPYEMVVGGARKAVVNDWVVVGGAKKAVVNRSVVVGGAKRPLV